MAGYLGSVPVPQATQHRETFTATAGQTTFNTAGYTPLFIDVYLNGVHLSPADITATNGSDVVLGACVVDDIVDVVSYTPFEVASQTFTGTTTMTDVVAATLDISGNIDIDGTTNLDVVDIDGAVNIATTALVTGILTTTAATVFNGGFASNANSTITGNVQIRSGNELQLLRADNGVAVDFSNDGAGVGLVIDDNNAEGFNVDFNGTRVFKIAGDGSLSTPSAGTSNVRFGVNAGNSIASGGNYNTVVGDEAGTAISTGDNNTAVGYQALDAEDTGGNSTAIGHKALSSQNNDDVNNYNTAVGSEAGITLTTGKQNVFVGGQAAKFATTATSSTFVGHKAGLGVEGTPLTGNSNTAIGQQAGLVLQGAAANNTIVGQGAAIKQTTAIENVILGSSAAKENLTGQRNTIIGNNAGANVTTSNNTFVGANGTSGGCGEAMTSGDANTILGGFTGNQGGLDIRTLSNNIVLSDGDGNPRAIYQTISGTGFWGFNLSDADDPAVYGYSTGGGMSVREDGLLGVARNNGNAANFNRTGNAGDVIFISKDGTIQGSISVSGTTVSYNGGHLARWSQPANNTRDDTLLKGTVLTNLDQMAVWGDEDNEQLNCTAKSSVEGDANVAGVFVNWDNDDDEYTNDMNIAMTGDMIIRIAQGTTVARGDLLMSAGDGTAKPQGDDIVRSKTIAKVTSTHVSNTYDDGSFCVPCVIMAC